VWVSIPACDVWGPDVGVMLLCKCGLGVSGGVMWVLFCVPAGDCVGG